LDAAQPTAPKLLQETTTTIPCPAASSVIDVDSLFEYEDTLQKSTGQPYRICEGYHFVLPEGHSPYTTYPLGLHESLTMPWVPQIALDGRLMLVSRSCLRTIPAGRTGPCQPCRTLSENKTLQGILTRAEKGVHENTGLAFHGFGSLQETLRRKNQRIEFYRLRGLNQARKLLGKAAALSDQKRLLMAISSGETKRLDRVISIALQQKKGARGILASVVAAAQGHYKPKSFVEEEEMKALVVFRMSGTRVAEFNHRAHGAPSVSYLRSRSTIPPIIPSRGRPELHEVKSNVEATVTSILDQIHHIRTGRVLHTVLMFDELATEKRIRWDPKTNNFLGLCREHAHRTSSQFINEGDLEELFKQIDDGNVHYAGEVSLFQFARICFRLT
jgi:hypothetical protein